MIDYDPHDWRSHLFDIRGSLVREIAGRVLSCVAWSAVVVMLFWLAQNHWLNYPIVGRFFPWLRADYLAVSPLLHSMMGFAMGLLLVFRTNSSYDRFWEGRKLWGSIVNASRNLARMACVHLGRNVPLRNEVVRWTIAFSYAAMFRLRGGTELGAIAGRLPPNEVLTARAAEHVPLEISRRITAQLKRAQELGILSEYLLVQLDEQVRSLVDSLGGCERIHKTPLPYAYMVHLRRVLIVYLYSLPFALYKDFGWTTIIATLFVSFIFFGIEEIGVEIEDPFEGADNDIPLEKICDSINHNLSALIGEGELSQSGQKS